MSSELETSQPELHLEELEIFLVGNRDLERQEARLDAHPLLRLRGRGVEACLRREGDRDLYAMGYIEHCRLLKGERDGYSDGLCRTCALAHRIIFHLRREPLPL
jgi:hypothetical protein